MKRFRPASDQQKKLGGYSFALEPSKPRMLYVGTYSGGQPMPQFHITLHPADKEAVVHQEMVTQREDGRRIVRHYFENYGQVTVQVRMERLS